MGATSGPLLGARCTAFWRMWRARAGQRRQQAASKRSSQLSPLNTTLKHTHTHTHTSTTNPYTNQPEDLRFRQAPTFEDCFPASTKEYKSVTHAPTGAELRVPFRRVHLTTGSHFDLYDTSGPRVRVVLCVDCRRASHLAAAAAGGGGVFLCAEGCVAPGLPARGRAPLCRRPPPLRRACPLPAPAHHPLSPPTSHTRPKQQKKNKNNRKPGRRPARRPPQAARAVGRAPRGRRDADADVLRAPGGRCDLD